MFTQTLQSLSQHGLTRSLYIFDFSHGNNTFTNVLNSSEKKTTLQGIQKARSCWNDRCDWQSLRYHASQRHVELAAHAVQAFEDALLPAGLCERAQTRGNVWRQIIQRHSWEKQQRLWNCRKEQRFRSAVGAGVTEIRADGLTCALRM